MEKKKISATFLLSCLCALLAFVCAMLLGELIYWYAFGLFFVFSLVKYSCDNAAKVPNDFPNDAR